MEVSNHIVLFLDILGYSSRIASCQNAHDENEYLQKVYGIMSDISGYLDAWKNYNADLEDLGLNRFKALLFSDNILFFAPYRDELDMHNLYMNLLYALSAFLVQYDKEDLFFRGGIARGKLFHDEKMHFVFGSGLVKAYELESKKALYPRIAISEELHPSPILVGLVQDEQKTWFLDYLSLGYSLICGNAQPSQHFLSCLQDEKTAINNALLKYRGNERVLEKYQWLKEYHDAFCDKQGLRAYKTGL